MQPAAIKTEESDQAAVVGLMGGKFNFNYLIDKSVVLCKKEFAFHCSASTLWYNRHEE